MRYLRRLFELSPQKIAAGYLLFGGIWILLSDSVVNQVVQDPVVLTRIQTLKGWLFVLLSGLLILALVRTREGQLRASRERLSRANQELSVLHRIYRHNIRNDLNVVRGYIDMVQTDIAEARQKQRLDLAYRSTNRILGVSEKLKAIEEAGTQSSSYGTVDVVEVIEKECERLQSEFPTLELEPDLPSQAHVYGDQTLAYVVRELLENSIEHHDSSPADCWIDITVERSLAEVVIHIADNGPGISKYEIEALESGQETPLAHSSGIGLWLVKWLCNFFDGSVKFDRGVERGTTVTLAFEHAVNIETVIDQAWSELPIQASA